MPAQALTPIPDLPTTLSLEHAAALAGRSVSWVRTHRTFGPLVPAELDGRHAVETASLLDMLARRRPAKGGLRGQHLQLVVDNDP